MTAARKRVGLRVQAGKDKPGCAELAEGTQDPLSLPSEDLREARALSGIGDAVGLVDPPAWLHREQQGEYDVGVRGQVVFAAEARPRERQKQESALVLGTAGGLGFGNDRPRC